MYFDWININWWGGNENKVTNNLRFFKWMHDEYGMKLDIYSLDASNVDNGPGCDWGEKPYREEPPRYGGIDSEWFKSKYPNGMDSITALANSFGCELGVWMGPDGYGETDSSARVRIDMLDRLTGKYNVALFKLDGCCSYLKPENEKYFIEAMSKSFANNPDLIVLNHRIPMSDSAKAFSTTFLWEGAETYIGVSGGNSKPAPHHRYTLNRGLTPDLLRLTEDHGVCLSSFLDYWEDDLILQAFNRNLILSPELYGNPWFLRDDEYPLLARIFNLHRRNGALLVNGMVLPEDQYGKNAVSRGDEKTRFITLRNLSWESKIFTIDIDATIGLENTGSFEVRQYHPYEKIMGVFEYGNQVDVRVLPYRSCLVKISSDPVELGIEGCNYQIVKDVPGEAIEIDLLGFPGEEKQVFLAGNTPKFRKVTIDGESVSKLSGKKSVTVKFEGDPLEKDYHRKLATLSPGSAPSRTVPFFEAMYFSASNNCLEAQSLARSGETNIAAVQNARDAFFYDDIFKHLGPWDHFALDDDPATTFKVRRYGEGELVPGLFRVTLPEAMDIDKVILEGVEREYRPRSAYCSNNLISWKKAGITVEKGKVEISTGAESVQYIKLDPSPYDVSEVKAYNNGRQVDITKAALSNLFPDSKENTVKKAWQREVQVDEITVNSTLAVAIEGDYGDNGAFSVIEVDGKLIGAFDRSPAYDFNNWEHVRAKMKGNFTYYFNLPKDFENKNIKVYVFGLTHVEEIKDPEVWVTAYPIPFVKKRLVLK